MSLEGLISFLEIFHAIMYPIFDCKVWVFGTEQIAVKEERGLYLKFLNILINDSIFLLDASLMILPKLEEMQVQLADTTERPAQERQQIEELYRQQEHVESHATLSHYS